MLSLINNDGKSFQLSKHKDKARPDLGVLPIHRIWSKTIHGKSHVSLDWAGIGSPKLRLERLYEKPHEKTPTTFRTANLNKREENHSLVFSGVLLRDKRFLSSSSSSNLWIIDLIINMFSTHWRNIKISNHSHCTSRKQRHDLKRLKTSQSSTKVLRRHLFIWKNFLETCRNSL